MAIAHDTRSDADHAGLLERLIAERGVGRHGIFLMSGEGRFTPDGFEETSGYVIDDAGRVFFFWTAWNEGLRHTTFKIWQPTEAEADWQGDAEYIAAREAAGLA